MPFCRVSPNLLQNPGTNIMPCLIPMHRVSRELLKFLLTLVNWWCLLHPCYTVDCVRTCCSVVGHFHAELPELDLGPCSTRRFSMDAEMVLLKTSSLLMLLLAFHPPCSKQILCCLAGLVVIGTKGVAAFRVQFTPPPSCTPPPGEPATDPVEVATPSKLPLLHMQDLVNLRLRPCEGSPAADGVSPSNALRALRIDKVRSFKTACVHCASGC